MAGLFFALMGAFLAVQSPSDPGLTGADWRRPAAMISTCSAVLFTWLSLLLTRESRGAFLTAVALVGLHELFALGCGVALSLSSRPPMALPSMFWISLAIAGLVPLAALGSRQNQMTGIPFIRTPNEPKRS